MGEGAWGEWFAPSRSFSVSTVRGCSLTCETHQKNGQLRRREVSDSCENRRLEGLTGEKGTGSRREMQNAKLLSSFIYFVKSVRILNQQQEPSNITEVKLCALITQNFTS